MVQASPSSQDVGQELGGSHVSPASMVPLPHRLEQSSSNVKSQPAGQQPSPSMHVTMATFEQATLQLIELPVMMSSVHESPSSQSVGHVLGGSQVSLPLRLPFPQLGEQSLSPGRLHPDGQHPSPSVQEEMGEDEHTTSQVEGSPDSESTVQPLPSSQDVGHEPGGSHVSPRSMTAFPQIETPQSLSVVESHPLGQQPSPPTQEVIGGKAHAASQVEGSPVRTSQVQVRPSSHEVGQELGGSHVSIPVHVYPSPQEAAVQEFRHASVFDVFPSSHSSPASTTELPHRGVQSPSVVALQPLGQHPSPPVHETIGVNEHEESHVDGSPVRTSVVQESPSSHEIGQALGGSHVSTPAQM